MVFESRPPGVSPLLEEQPCLKKKKSLRQPQLPTLAVSEMEHLGFLSLSAL